MINNKEQLVAGRHRCVVHPALIAKAAFENPHLRDLRCAPRLISIPVGAPSLATWIFRFPYTSRWMVAQTPEHYK
jgi:hypothetical protein